MFSWEPHPIKYPLNMQIVDQALIVFLNNFLSKALTLLLLSPDFYHKVIYHPHTIYNALLHPETVACVCFHQPISIYFYMAYYFSIFSLKWYFYLEKCCFLSGFFMWWQRRGAEMKPNKMFHHHVPALESYGSWWSRLIENCVRTQIRWKLTENTRVWDIMGFLLRILACCLNDYFVASYPLSSTHILSFFSGKT